MMTIPINKNFWEHKHDTNDTYWLTGSGFESLLDVYDIDKISLNKKTVLEIGVGKGNFSESVLPYCEKIYCCDISEKALNKLNESVAGKFLTTDLKNIPEVDLAICHLVFQHCEDKEMSRIIKDINLSPNGSFYFQFASLRKNEKPNDFVKSLINSGSHFFRDLEVVETFIENGNKKISRVYDVISHYGKENFDWYIIKIENK